MLPVVRITSPTPYPVGDINLYLLLLEPVTLIDAGSFLPAAQAIIESALAEHNLTWPDIRRLVLTHGHMDHSEMAEIIRQRSGATVFLHPLDIPKLDLSLHTAWERRIILSRAGAPQEVVEDSLAPLASRRPGLPRLTTYHCLEEGDYLQLGRYRLEILHLPGHSRGQINLFEPQTGSFWAGDNLLLDVSPNPVVEVDPASGERIPCLPHYLESLARISRLPIRQVYPAHGQLFQEAAPRCTAIRQHHLRHLQRVWRTLEDSGSTGLTAYQVARVIYPRVQGFDVFLAISAVLGLLDILTDKHRLEISREGETEYFHPLPPIPLASSRLIPSGR